MHRYQMAQSAVVSVASAESSEVQEVSWLVALEAFPSPAAIPEVWVECREVALEESRPEPSVEDREPDPSQEVFSKIFEVGHHGLF
jgi:hypothetical protein